MKPEKIEEIRGLLEKALNCAKDKNIEKYDSIDPKQTYKWIMRDMFRWCSDALALLKPCQESQEPKEFVVNAINALEKHREEAVITCEETCLCWELATLINYIIGGEVEPESQEPDHIPEAGKKVEPAKTSEFVKECNIHLKNDKGGMPLKVRVNIAETALTKACDCLEAETERADKAECLQAFLFYLKGLDKSAEEIKQLQEKLKEQDKEIDRLNQVIDDTRETEGLNKP